VTRSWIVPQERKKRVAEVQEDAPLAPGGAASYY
jgi:hypothetical protein